MAKIKMVVTHQYDVIPVSLLILTIQYMTLQQWRIQKQGVDEDRKIGNQNNFIRLRICNIICSNSAFVLLRLADLFGLIQFLRLSPH